MTNAEKLNVYGEVDEASKAVKDLADRFRDIENQMNRFIVSHSTARLGDLTVSSIKLHGLLESLKLEVKNAIDFNDVDLPFSNNISEFTRQSVCNGNCSGRDCPDIGI